MFRWSWKRIIHTEHNFDDFLIFRKQQKIKKTTTFRFFFSTFLRTFFYPKTKTKNGTEDDVGNNKRLPNKRLPPTSKPASRPCFPRHRGNAELDPFLETFLEEKRHTSRFTSFSLIRRFSSFRTGKCFAFRMRKAWSS